MVEAVKKTIVMLGYRLRLWSLGFALYRLKNGGPMLAVFTFHRVTDAGKSAGHYMYYEKGLHHEVFDRQIAAIDRYFDVVDLDEFIDILKGQKPLQKHTALITFDDADYDFLEHALPYLKKRDLPTVMFAPTDYIDGDGRFWHLRVSNIIRKLTPETWEAMQRRAECLPESVRILILGPFPENDDSRAGLARALNRHFDREHINDVLAIIEDWETILGKEFVLDIKCMNWNELRELSCDKVAVESHSASHGKLGQLDSCDVEKELLDSKIKIEKELDKTVKAISYPGGSYNRQVLEIASQTGYEVGFVTEYGFCKYPAEGEELYKLPRYSLYGDTDTEIHYALGLMAFKGALGLKL